MIQAVTVAVDYPSIRLTLPRMAETFDSVLLITSECDVWCPRELPPNVQVFKTDAFWRHESVFNKWRAIEEAPIARDGWVALVDADIVLPSGVAALMEGLDKTAIYACRGRRILAEEMPSSLPPEDTWPELPPVGHDEGWAGFFQLFHGQDTHAHIPWHDPSLGHAGCADTWFEERWPPSQHLRLPFEVLHLGIPFANWCGRRLDADKQRIFMRHARRGRRVRDR